VSIKNSADIGDPAVN